MAQLYLNDYLSSLHRQISASVDRLKSRSPSPDTAGLMSNESGQDDLPPQEVRSHAYRLLDSGVSYELSRYSSADSRPADNGYAAGSYRQAAGINREPTVLIDFMFENNREFDFKV